MNQIHFFSSMCAPCECWAVLCFLGTSVPDLSISSAGACGVCSGVNLSIRKPLLRISKCYLDSYSWLVAGDETVSCPSSEGAGSSISV